MDFLPPVFSGVSAFFSGGSSGSGSGSLCSCSIRSPTVSFSGAETTVCGMISFFVFTGAFGSLPGAGFARFFGAEAGLSVPSGFICRSSPLVSKS